MSLQCRFNWRLQWYWSVWQQQIWFAHQTWVLDQSIRVTVFLWHPEHVGETDLVPVLTPEAVAATVKVQTLHCVRLQLINTYRYSASRSSLIWFFTNKTGTKRFAHICRLYVKPDAKTGFGKEHSTLAAFLVLRRRAVLTQYSSC